MFQIPRSFVINVLVVMYLYSNTFIRLHAMKIASKLFIPIVAMSLALLAIVGVAHGDTDGTIPEETAKRARKYLHFAKIPPVS